MRERCRTQQVDLHLGHHPGTSELRDAFAQAELGEDLVGVLAQRRGRVRSFGRRPAELDRMAGEAGPPDDVVVVVLEEPDRDGVRIAGSSSGERTMANGTRSASKRGVASAMVMFAACA